MLDRQARPFSAGRGSGLCIGNRRDDGAQLCTSEVGHGVLTILLLVLLLAGVAFCSWYLLIPRGRRGAQRHRRKR
jgi:hypothetical protein